MRTRTPGALATLLLTWLRLSACDCGPAGPACSYVGHASAVFIGKVEFTDHDPAMGLRQRTFVKFGVEEAFKGLSSGQREVWVDPGSFTSCYAEYTVGDRMLVFAYAGPTMPPDTPLMSLVPGQLKQKPLPEGINPDRLPVVYSAPECSGTRSMTNTPGWNADIEYLRAYRNGVATPTARGRVTEDANFGIFGFDPLPGLPAVKMTLTGSGINRSVRTDSDGYYAFDNIPAGAYIIAPFLPPYVARGGPRETTVPRNGCGAADFDMFAPGVIQGNLLDSGGRPAVKVRVEVLRLNTNGKPIYYAQKQTLTNRQGQYRFDELPSGNFLVGVNIFNAPDPETPYAATRWSAKDLSSIHLMPGERKQISPLRLPAPSAVRKIEAEVRWPDGSPAGGVTVWGEVADRAAASGRRMPMAWLGLMFWKASCTLSRPKFGSAPAESAKWHVLVLCP